MNNKPWYKKIHILMPTIASICTIVGISILDGKSLLDNKDTNDSMTNFESNDIKTGAQSPIINGGGEVTINYGNTEQDSSLSSKPNSLSSSENNTEERYHKGTITKTGWESKFIGLRYTNPEGMSMSTEEELDEMNKLEEGTPSIIFNQNELGKSSLTSIFEMKSISDDNSIIAGVCVERLLDKVDVSQFIEEFESQMNRNIFIDYELISDDEIVKIGNDDYIMVSYIISSNNVFRYQYSYFRIVGDRVIMIVLNFNDEKARDNVLDAFTAY